MSLDIKQKIDSNNELIASELIPGMFVLNPKINALMQENLELQKQCKHEFYNGKCIFCYKENK